MVTTIYLTISTDHFIDKPQTSNHRNNDDINGNPCTAYVDNSHTKSREVTVHWFNTATFWCIVHIGCAWITIVHIGCAWITIDIIIISVI
jgi:hypothetical protein